MKLVARWAQVAASESFVLERQTQITEGLRTKLSFLLLECDGGTQHGGHFA